MPSRELLAKIAKLIDADYAKGIKERDRLVKKYVAPLKVSPKITPKKAAVHAAKIKAGPKDNHTPRKMNRRSEANVAALVARVLACFVDSTVTLRAADIAQCIDPKMAPTKLSWPLKKLQKDGKIVQHGERAQATYTLKG